MWNWCIYHTMYFLPTYDQKYLWVENIFWVVWKYCWGIFIYLFIAFLKTLLFTSKNLCAFSWNVKLLNIAGLNSRSCIFHLTEISLISKAIIQKFLDVYISVVECNKFTKDRKKLKCISYQFTLTTHCNVVKHII